MFIVLFNESIMEEFLKEIPTKIAPKSSRSFPIKDINNHCLAKGFTFSPYLALGLLLEGSPKSSVLELIPRPKLKGLKLYPAYCL